MPGTVSNFDAIVIGAGAAGLAAASELAANGRKVCVLEARDRLGGRIYTLREPNVPVPLELGAEFIHGESRSTLDWLRKANEPVADAAQTRWVSKNGELQPANGIFEEMKNGLRKIKRPATDLPFLAFLEEGAARKLAPRLRTFARMLVEGFDAADATRVSTHEILDEWNGSGAADAPTFRPVNGYSSVIGAIAATLPADRVRVRMNSVVKEVHWKRGAVGVAGTCFGDSFKIEASQAIVTLPLGVLQLPADSPHGVRFVPTLPRAHDALAMLGSAPVLKLILRFQEPFWESLDGGRYRGVAFFQAPNQVFPTFWTSLPMRTSHLVAWTAGPNVARLAGYESAQVVTAAVRSLQAIFGKRIAVADQLTGVHVHDWQADPFACGAYSYLIAGGAGARKRLAAPIQDTLYLAGEALDLEGGSGTVGGALQSGRRAAQLALRVGKDQKKISRKDRQDRQGRKCTK
jgi:monoamine oxidase